MAKKKNRASKVCPSCKTYSSDFFEAPYPKTCSGCKLLTFCSKHCEQVNLKKHGLHCQDLAQFIDQEELANNKRIVGKVHEKSNAIAISLRDHAKSKAVKITKLPELVCQLLESGTFFNDFTVLRKKRPLRDRFFRRRLELQRQNDRIQIHMCHSITLGVGVKTLKGFNPGTTLCAWGAPSFFL